MQPIARDVERSVVCVCLLVCVGHADVLCEKRWTTPYADLGNWL